MVSCDSGGPRIELLQAIGALLDGNNDRFVFVSQRMRQNGSLQRARDAATAAEFETKFLSAEGGGGELLSAPTPLETDGRPGCIPIVSRRIQITTIDERMIAEQTHTRVRSHSWRTEGCCERGPCDRYGLGARDHHPDDRSGSSRRAFALRHLRLESRASGNSRGDGPVLEESAQADSPGFSAPRRNEAAAGSSRQ
jgi:hypothetical protein